MLSTPLAPCANTGHYALVPPCIDVYSMSPRRDRKVIEQFLATYARSDQTVESVELLPPGYQGPVDELPRDEWLTTPVSGLEDLLTLSVAPPTHAFTVYLRPQPPWCGVILSCARTGEVTFGVSVDDPLEHDEPREIATQLLQALCESTGGTRGWAVHERPPSLDPHADHPWDETKNVADFVR